MVRNLRCARQKWVRLTWILSREGAYSQTSGKIYLAVAKLVIMYGSEKCVLTPRMKRVLDGFHHRVDRRLTGRQPMMGRYGGWV